MNKLKKVFEPITINGLTLPNRIVMSPMVTHYATDNGSVNQRVIDYYTARAEGGAAFITVETAYVDLTSIEYHMLGVYDDKLVPGLKKLTDAIHAKGAKVSIQINHKGRLASSKMTYARTVSASNEPELGETPRSLTSSEVKAMVEKYAQAARRVKEAGFDAVEIHMAHGYLINQFLSPYSNKRTDEYGGSVENRARFAVEIVRRVREIVGADFPITAKICAAEYVSGGLEVEDWKTILPMLEKAGVDMINVSGGISETTQYMTMPMAVPRGFNVENAKAIKQFAHIPVSVVGRIPEITMAEEILERGDADLVYMARPFLADPQLMNKAAEGRLEDIRPCINCNQGCIGRVDKDADICCLANPVSGRENYIKEVAPAAEAKNVLVIGGGPAGLQAAATAAQRGHNVTLYEASDVLGGQFYLACMPPRKKELPRLLSFLEHDARKSGVKIVMNHKVTASDIESSKPDAVIMATGGTPIVIPVPGHERCLIADDVLTGKAKAQSPCVVIGGGSVGCEVADFLIEQGNEVTIVEMMPALCQDLERRSRKIQLLELVQSGATTLCNAKVLQIGEDFVEYDCLGVTQRVTGLKNVVMAAGYRPNIQDDITDTCTKMGIPFYYVGDSVKRRSALTAIREGFDCARSI